MNLGVSMPARASTYRAFARDPRSSLASSVALIITSTYLPAPTVDLGVIGAVGSVAIFRTYSLDIGPSRQIYRKYDFVVAGLRSTRYHDPRAVFT